MLVWGQGEPSVPSAGASLGTVGISCHTLAFGFRPAPLEVTCSKHMIIISLRCSRAHIPRSFPLYNPHYIYIECNNILILAYDCLFFTMWSCIQNCKMYVVSEVSKLKVQDHNSAKPNVYDLLRNRFASCSKTTGLNLSYTTRCGLIKNISPFKIEEFTDYNFKDKRMCDLYMMARTRRLSMGYVKLVNVSNTKPNGKQNPCKVNELAFSLLRIFNCYRCTT